MAKTLFQLAGADPQPVSLSQAVLVLIDIQNEYFDGPLILDGVTSAAETAAGLLARARAVGTPVIHVRHVGKPGGAFDPTAPRGAIHDSVTPVDGETVIEKTLPNAFSGTKLADVLAMHPNRQPLLAGFMTHMCVSATARSALDHGKLATIAIDATATRALPDPMGDEIAAPVVHRAALAALGDRFAVLARAAEIKN